MRNAEPFADLRDHLRFGAAFGPKPVIDGRRFDLQRPRLGGEEQQSEAVGTAGNGEPDGRARLDQRVEVAPEPIDRPNFRLGLLRARHCRSSIGRVS